jgi:phenylalanyl-tRNA synthetase alpha chain
MTIPWTAAQQQRLNELDADDESINMTFEDASSRKKHFQKIEKHLAGVQRQRIREYRDDIKRPALSRLESALVSVLIAQGFVQVATPIIMSKGLLKKMSIDADHPLNSQIFWIEPNKCLRPMLAPHLYYVLMDLLRLWEKPVRIFEIGPCFRKETKGAQHASEFTMFNLVEMGLPEDYRENRIRELGDLALKTARIKEFSYEVVPSEIYGDTIDILAGDDSLEVGSAAMGPHILDRPWKIHTTWIGIGFGLERMLMAAHKTRNLAKMGRSLSYLDGIRLNI